MDNQARTGWIRPDLRDTGLSTERRLEPVGDASILIEGGNAQPQAPARLMTYLHLGPCQIDFVLKLSVDILIIMILGNKVAGRRVVGHRQQAARATSSPKKALGSRRIVAALDIESQDRASLACLDEEAQESGVGRAGIQSVPECAFREDASRAESVNVSPLGIERAGPASVGRRRRLKSQAVTSSPSFGFVPQPDLLRTSSRSRRQEALQRSVIALGAAPCEISQIDRSQGAVDDALRTRGSGATLPATRRDRARPLAEIAGCRVREPGGPRNP
jgi:hypothetical protein